MSTSATYRPTFGRSGYAAVAALLAGRRFDNRRPASLLDYRRLKATNRLKMQSTLDHHHFFQLSNRLNDHCDLFMHNITIGRCQYSSAALGFFLRGANRDLVVAA